MREEQCIIEQLKAQKQAVKPSWQLLGTILERLGLEEQPRSFPWFRFAIPVAGFALLIGGIFFATQYLQPAAPAPAEVQALSLVSIVAEEQRMEEQLTYEQFFQEELQIQQVDTALTDF